MEDVQLANSDLPCSLQGNVLTSIVKILIMMLVQHVIQAMLKTQMVSVKKMIPTAWIKLLEDVSNVSPATTLSLMELALCCQLTASQLICRQGPVFNASQITKYCPQEAPAWKLSQYSIVLSLIQTTLQSAWSATIDISPKEISAQECLGFVINTIHRLVNAFLALIAISSSTMENVVMLIAFQPQLKLVQPVNKTSFIIQLKKFANSQILIVQTL